MRCLRLGFVHFNKPYDKDLRRERANAVPIPGRQTMRQGLTLPATSDALRLLAGRTVLQIIPELDAGGAERTAVDIAEALVSCGARALVASDGGRLVSELQARGGLWVPFPAKTKNPIKMLFNIRKLAQLIRAERIDLVHARSRAPAWVALGAARAAGVPFVTTYHGAYSGKSALKIRYNSVMARGDLVIANSHFTAKRILEQHPFAEGRIRVIHRGTDPAQFSALAVDAARVRRLREQWEVAPDERIVLLAARLTEWKGQRVLIDAAKILRDQGTTGIKYLLAGDPQGRSNYVRELDAAISSAGLDGVVQRVGHCADMPAAMMTASAITVCSTQPEAFGRVATEAQFLGKPVIVTDIGAAPETVLSPPEVAPSERTGWKVPPGDPLALSQALRTVLSLGASDIDRLARQARAHVERNFSLAHMCTETLQIYSELIASGETRVISDEAAAY